MNAILAAKTILKNLTVIKKNKVIFSSFGSCWKLIFDFVIMISRKLKHIETCVFLKSVSPFLDQ